MPSEQLVVGWVVAGLRCPLNRSKKEENTDGKVPSATTLIYNGSAEDPTAQIPFRICRIITRLRSAHPQVIFRSISRREVEVPIISILLKLIRSEIGPLTEMYRHGRMQLSSSGEAVRSLGGVVLEERTANGTPVKVLSNSTAGVPDFGYFITSTADYLQIDPASIPEPSESLVIVLRACLACCKDMNLRPIWFGERWSFHWSFGDRYFLSREFSDLMFLLWHHYRFVVEVEVKSLCLGILVAIADKVRQDPVNNIPVRPPGKAAAGPAYVDSNDVDAGDKFEDVDGVYISDGRVTPPHRRRSWSRSQSFSSAPPTKVVIVPISKILPLLAISLSQFTRGIDRKSDSKNTTARNIDSRGVLTDKPFGHKTESSRYRLSECTPTLDPGHMDAESYAIHSEAVLYMMEGLKLFLCNDDDQTILSQHEHYFSATPLCESILYLMDLYPAVNVIQKIGLSLLLYLCKTDGKNIDVLGERCRCIISAVISFPTDRMVHHTFCTLVLILAQRHEKHRNALVFHAIYKWLFIPIKFGWEDVTPIACQAVAAVADTAVRAEMVGMARLCEVLVCALGKHKNAMALQIDGLRAVIALAKSPSCLQKMKNSGGKKILMETRRMLMKTISENGLIPSGYKRDDLIEMLTATNNYPGLFDKDKCVIS